MDRPYFVRVFARENFAVRELHTFDLQAAVRFLEERRDNPEQETVLHVDIQIFRDSGRWDLDG